MLGIEGQFYGVPVTIGSPVTLSTTIVRKLQFDRVFGMQYFREHLGHYS